MIRTSVPWASLIGLILLSQSLKADALVGPGGAFQPWTASILGTGPLVDPSYSGPYWNGWTGYGNKYNIGWCLVGTGGCVIASPPGAIAYWGKATGAAVQSMSFQNSGTAVSVSLLGMFTNQLGTAQNSGYNVFGWYEINTNGTIGALTPLWNSKTATTGESAVFSPTGSYGLFLENIQGNGQADYFWFMNSTQDYSVGPQKNPVDSNQHFAVFSGVPGQFFVGMADTNFGDRGYSDMVVKVTNVPEVSAVSLLFGGLLFSLPAFRRKYRRYPAARLFIDPLRVTIS